jgi:hypothetical protein
MFEAHIINNFMIVRNPYKKSDELGKEIESWQEMHPYKNKVPVLEIKNGMDTMCHG